ncbi:MAG: acetyl-CoA carboxylase biotin carboxyl carrier protein [Candidatus Marinimicrobia bacterium]|nr:acetyl-CoA carboxylase biotin carboxyl carrier protein [Candidatus Neomarinimicrobiota bacterium]
MWKNKLKDLIYILEHSDVNEIEATFWGRKYRVVKNSSVINPEMIPAYSTTLHHQNPTQLIGPESSGEILEESANEIKSPMPGTYYCSPSPEAPPYVKVGDRVTEGDSLCIVEAMKIMNEIESNVTGVVKEVLVENGKPVEYNQPLFRIE